MAVGSNEDALRDSALLNVTCEAIARAQPSSETGPIYDLDVLAREAFLDSSTSSIIPSDQHSSLHPQPSTHNTPPPTHNPQHSTLNSGLATCTAVRYTTNVPTSVCCRLSTGPRTPRGRPLLSGMAVAATVLTTPRMRTVSGRQGNGKGISSGYRVSIDVPI